MKFLKPSYPYILFLASLFILAALQTPSGEKEEINISNIETQNLLESNTSDDLLYADINE